MPIQLRMEGPFGRLRAGSAVSPHVNHKAGPSTPQFRSLRERNSYARMTDLLDIEKGAIYRALLFSGFELP
jgi:hypothetical protein